MIWRSRLFLGILSVLVCAMGMLGQEADRPEAPALVTQPMPFIGITPCRIADTRDPNRPPGYGPPALPPGFPPRIFTLAGQCGIPSGAQAVSLNVTAVNPQGNGYLVLYPQGGAFPGVSTLNFLDRTVANAAIVPLSAGGEIAVVAGVNGTDLILDVNGYYAGSAVGSSDTFLGSQSGNATMTGLQNTGLGGQTLLFTTLGHLNTAVGFSTLLLNDNVYDRGGSDTGNTGVGTGALVENVKGYPNTAFGVGALHTYMGTNQMNVAVGMNSLHDIQTTYANVGVGSGTLSVLENISPISHQNLALGYNAGSSSPADCGTCWNNVYIAHPGGGDEHDVVRLGLAPLLTSAYLAGVRSATIGSSPLLVLVDGLGQFGTTSSSERHKRDIRDMSPESEKLRELRPVTFRYNDQPRLQYGLIAEEVEQVLPDLVVCDPTGQPQSVMYHELPAMILNELQRQARRLGSDEEEALERRRLLAARDDADRAEQRRIEELLARVAERESRPEKKPAN